MGRDPHTTGNRAQSELAYYSRMQHIDDEDLDPFGYRLLGHIRRRCGAKNFCYCSIPSMATGSQMSIPTLLKCLDSLEHRWRRIEVKARPGHTSRITLVNTMPENLRRMAELKEKRQADREAAEEAPTPTKSCRGRNDPPLQETRGDPCKKLQVTPTRNKGGPPQKVVDEGERERKNKEETAAAAPAGAPSAPNPSEANVAAAADFKSLGIDDTTCGWAFHRFDLPKIERAIQAFRAKACAERIRNPAGLMRTLLTGGSTPPLAKQTTGYAQPRKQTEAEKQTAEATRQEIIDAELAQRKERANATRRNEHAPAGWTR
jgi:hypothetical protein